MLYFPVFTLCPRFHIIVFMLSHLLEMNSSMATPLDGSCPPNGEGEHPDKSLSFCNLSEIFKNGAGSLGGGPLPPEINQKGLLSVTGDGSIYNLWHGTQTRHNKTQIKCIFIVAREAGPWQTAPNNKVRFPGNGDRDFNAWLFLDSCMSGLSGIVFFFIVAMDTKHIYSGGKPVFSK